MEKNHGSSHENIWHQQQQQLLANEQNKQYFRNPYQPMQHAGFELQREIVVQPTVPSANTTPENVHFLRDVNGPYVKIYYSDNNKEYELFEHTQKPQPSSEDQVFINNNVDVFNNFMPNTQNQMTFQSHMMNQQQQPQKYSNNSVIHHLVTSNLGPGKFEFGTFGGSNNNNANNNNNTGYSSSEPPLNISIPTLLDHVKSSSSSSFKNIENGDSASINTSLLNSSIASPSQLTSTTTANANTAPSNQNKKQRIIAEVKPMRMSYSDVVSKNVNGQIPTAPSSSSSSGPPNSNSSSPNTTMPVSSKANKTKYQASATGSNNNNANNNNNSSFERKQNENADKNRKSPVIVNNANSSEIKKNQTTTIKLEKPSPIQSTPSTQNVQPQTVKKKKQQTKDSLNVKSSANRNDAVKTNKYATDSDYEENDDDNENSSMLDSDNEDETSEYYDIRKNVYQGEHHKVEKIKSSSSYKKSKQTPLSTSSTAKKNERSHKRITGKSSNRKQKHEFLQKLFASCIEYLYIFVKWLWMLIYDVSYLSTGIIWDRLSWTYQRALQGFMYVRNELKGNIGKACITWVKNTWKKFDTKFDKKSKWAFWRWIFKKQSTNDNTKDYYKDGKLPKTAEEAMKSLLNCKEKDAYSILGVSADCPQEQIKKHYKKLAVLVHPDKNKTAGAEEAFKILQRSFELIAEPESRKQYDENLTKALHTEKAFNELNDLLIQLQTKISEAANTIRCSSCCFRHPRKPTGRKAFAARECSQCKIRHPAREGDIWAETTFFGLRWKYLALMEGNVYDITEWALCQRGALSHLQANSCVVQYKIVLGGNQQQQQQQQQQNQSGDQKERDRFKKDAPVHEPQEDFFLNNIYAGQSPHQNATATRRRYKKN